MENLDHYNLLSIVKQKKGSTGFSGGPIKGLIIKKMIKKFIYVRIRITYMHHTKTTVD